MKYVLDSNVVIAALNGHAEVQRRLSHVAAVDVSIPVVVVGELLYGARRSSRVGENLERVRAIQSAFAIADVTTAVADRYAVLRTKLERAGQPRTDFDLVILATAAVLDAVLVTNDRALQVEVEDGPRVEDWLSGPG